ncbi:hypothetical protein NCLIV_017820 [Neospora caninum Liverpool]|uniref:Uncharacterized protein n=1 Tax=Neospora caninum (strain Liverpool) TaxID=572307 RepID=F0VE47_NEOCL|nr:hypothetical protein NCLIV_017820 [Neospora caninum Liverpool]CBZ51990.1 hypothetical protein NCLIV_017820 [Neospora caninum Liverpool]CEL65950.1 TPA: hypothetical protein BN1204_017820 [Neospora caninum Liverpool]|eukprot:XP_003882023.1 hypothetical protein NCLIV_017820 [Neospora caninum Liverpool]
MRAFVVLLLALSWRLGADFLGLQESAVLLPCSAVRLFKAAQLVSGLMGAAGAMQNAGGGDMQALGTQAVQATTNQSMQGLQSEVAKTKKGEDDEDEGDDGRKQAAHIVRTVGGVATQLAEGFGLGALVGGATNLIAGAVAGKPKGSKSESKDDDDEDDDDKKSKEEKGDDDDDDDDKKSKKRKGDDDDDDDDDKKKRKGDDDDDDDDGKKSKKKKRDDDDDE